MLCTWHCYNKDRWAATSVFFHFVTIVSLGFAKQQESNRWLVFTYSQSVRNMEKKSEGKWLFGVWSHIKIFIKLLWYGGQCGGRDVSTCPNTNKCLHVWCNKETWRQTSLQTPMEQPKKLKDLLRQKRYKLYSLVKQEKEIPDKIRQTNPTRADKNIKKSSK